MSNVTPISSAPSFAGVVHDAKWRTYTIECLDDVRAEQFVEHLAGHRLPATAHGAVVSVSYDLAQARQEQIPLEVSLAAQWMGFADADVAIETFTEHAKGAS